MLESFFLLALLHVAPFISATHLLGYIFIFPLYLHVTGSFEYGHDFFFPSDKRKKLRIICNFFQNGQISKTIASIVMHIEILFAEIE